MFIFLIYCFINYIVEFNLCLVIASEADIAINWNTTIIIISLFQKVPKYYELNKNDN